MVGDEGTNAGSCIACPPYIPPPLDCSEIILFKKCPSVSTDVTSTLRVSTLMLKTNEYDLRHPDTFEFINNCPNTHLETAKLKVS